MMESVQVESDEILVSSDVSSLFTNAPVGEAISVIHERLRKDDTLGDRIILSPEQVAELLEMCLIPPTSAMEETFMSRRKVLLDHCDEETEREEQLSPTFDLQ